MWARRVPIYRRIETAPARRRAWVRLGAAMLAAFLLPAAASGQAGRPAPLLAAADDLAVDGRTALARGVPLVILFSMPGCSYCEVVRRNYLAPLAREGEPGQRPLVREADLSSSAPLRGFGGADDAFDALARRYRIRAAPSVLIVDGRGRQLALVLEGGDVAGMYGAYLDQRLADARRALERGD